MKSGWRVLRHMLEIWMFKEILVRSQVEMRNIRY